MHYCLQEVIDFAQDWMRVSREKKSGALIFLDTGSSYAQIVVVIKTVD